MLRCLFGHDEPVRDDVDGVKVWRCPRCWKVRERGHTRDPRPVHAPDNRFVMSAWQQAGARRKAQKTHAGRTLTTNPKIHAERVSA